MGHSNVDFIAVPYRTVQCITALWQWTRHQTTLWNTHEQLLLRSWFKWRL